MGAVRGEILKLLNFCIYIKLLVESISSIQVYASLLVALIRVELETLVFEPDVQQLFQFLIIIEVYTSYVMALESVKPDALVSLTTRPRQ